MALADSMRNIFSGINSTASQASATVLLNQLGLANSHVDEYVANLANLSSVLSPNPTAAQISAFNQINLNFGQSGIIMITSQPGLESFPNGLNMTEPLNQQFFQYLQMLQTLRQSLTAETAYNFYTVIAPEKYARFLTMLKDVSDLAVSKQGLSTTSGQTTTSTSGQATTTISAGKGKLFSVLRTLSNEIFFQLLQAKLLQKLVGLKIKIAMIFSNLFLDHQLPQLLYYLLKLFTRTSLVWV